MIVKIHQPIAIHELGKRQNQEDAIYPAINKATAEDRLFIVCDGMGGHEKGEVASNLVCSELSDYIKSRNTVLTDVLFKEALERVYAQLDSMDDGAYKKMGTTLTLLYFHQEGCTLVHIGDSRIYHVRPSEKRMLYKSRDHSLVYDLYQSGEITFEEMKTSPQKNVITRALMPGKDNRVKADITHVTDIQSGDYFYLCSDGMLEQMEDSELLQILSADSSNEKKRSQLVAATMDNSDNHSAYLIQISEVSHEGNEHEYLNNEEDVPWNVADEAVETIEDAVDISVVEVPTPDAQKPTPKPAPIQHKSSRKSKSYLSYIVAALAIALCFFVYGTLKGCNQTGKKEEPNNWTVPEQNDKVMMRPVQRPAKTPTQPRNNPNVKKVSNQKTSDQKTGEQKTSDQKTENQKTGKQETPESKTDQQTEMPAETKTNVNKGKVNPVNKVKVKIDQKRVETEKEKENTGQVDAEQKGVEKKEVNNQESNQQEP